MTTTAIEYDTGIDATINRIRKALRERSGKSWSVKRGKGTAYSWITIESPPARQIAGENTQLEMMELAQLLGLDTVHHQGESVPAGSDYRREYIDRAEGRTPSVKGEPYWD